MNDMNELSKIARFFYIVGSEGREGICEFCVNKIPCEKNCECFTNGTKAIDCKTGKEIDWKWSCLDLAWGECPKMENTPCNGCLVNDWCNFRLDMQKFCSKFF